MAKLEQIAAADTGNLGTVLCASNLPHESARFAAQARVFTEGDSGGSVYVVRSGRLELLLTVKAGELIPVRTVGPGEVIGLASAMNKAPYCKTAIALDETILDRFDANEVVEFLAAHPESHVKALTFLCADADAMQRILAHAKATDRAHHVHKRP